MTKLILGTYKPIFYYITWINITYYINNNIIYIIIILY